MPRQLRFTMYTRVSCAEHIRRTNFFGIRLKTAICSLCANRLASFGTSAYSIRGETNSSGGIGVCTLFFTKQKTKKYLLLLFFFHVCLAYSYYVYVTSTPVSAYVYRASIIVCCGNKIDDGQYSFMEKSQGCNAHRENKKVTRIIIISVKGLPSIYVYLYINKRVYKRIFRQKQRKLRVRGVFLNLCEFVSRDFGIIFNYTEFARKNKKVVCRDLPARKDEGSQCFAIRFIHRRNRYFVNRTKRYSNFDYRSSDRVRDTGL